MKKIISVLLILLALLTCLAACEKPTKPTNPWEDPALSEEHATIRKISDAAIMQAYGFEAKDLFFYNVSINTTNQGGIVVYYKLCFYGYDTLEHYWVNLSANYELEGVKESELGVYSRFISDISEEAVKNAEAAVDEKLKLYEDVSEKFLSIDEGGNLCLTVEIIEDIVPPIADENGNTEGCDLDHRHLLINEIICHAK